jgi:hypothetical protein
MSYADSFLFVLFNAMPASFTFFLRINSLNNNQSHELCHVRCNDNLKAKLRCNGITVAINIVTRRLATRPRSRRSIHFTLLSN